MDRRKSKMNQSQEMDFGVKGSFFLDNLDTKRKKLSLRYDVHPSFHINSIFKKDLVDSEKYSLLFKTYDQRDSKHLGVYGLNYSFLEPTHISPRPKLEKNFFGSKKGRVRIVTGVSTPRDTFVAKKVIRTKKPPDFSIGCLTTARSNLHPNSNFLRK